MFDRRYAAKLLEELGLFSDSVLVSSQDAGDTLAAAFAKRRS
jgi:hypothetical protein